MFLRKVDGIRTVRLSNGSIFSQSDLPPTGTTRWVASRKAAVVRGVAYGLISKEEALARYQLSDEEFLQWSSAIHRHGEEALKTTALQKYRQP